MATRKQPGTRVRIHVRKLISSNDCGGKTGTIERLAPLQSAWVILDEPFRGATRTLQALDDLRIIK